MEARLTRKNEKDQNNNQAGSHNIVITPQLQDNITSLKMKNKCFDICVIKKIFMGTPHLQNLELINVQLHPITPECKKITKKLLPELTSLTFLNCDMEILSILSPFKVTNLHLASTTFQSNQHLNQFLKKCTLASLEVHGIGDITEFFNVSIKPFKLRHLTVSSTLPPSEPCRYNQKAFLFFTKNIATLESCCIRAQLPWDSLNILLKKPAILKSLTLQLSLLPPMKDFFVQTEPRMNVKTLVLEGPHIDLAQMDSIFKLYTGVVSLTLEKFNTDLVVNHVTNVLELVANHCLRLTELTISRLPSLPWHVKFSSLTVLRVRYINTVDEIISIFNNSRNLRILHVDFIYRRQLNQESIDRLLLCNLTHLHLTAEPFECLKILQMIIASTEKTLENLELRTHAFEVNKSYSIRFKKKGKHAHNFVEMEEKLRLDVIDFVTEEFISMESETDEDSNIIDYILNCDA